MRAAAEGESLAAARLQRAMKRSRQRKNVGLNCTLSLYERVRPRVFRAPGRGSDRFRQKRRYRDRPRQQVGQRIGQTDPKKQNRAGGS